MSLGFVFSALVEFTVIIMLKRMKMRKVMSKGTKQICKQRKIADVANQSKPSESLNEVAEANCKGSKFRMAANDASKSQEEELDMIILRKIDFFCFFAYLLGYILFNICYWSKMLAA